MKLSSAFAGLLFASGIAAAVGWSVQKNGLQPAPEKIKNRAAPQPSNQERWRVPIGSSPVRGPADALVTIVEFGDFQCPFTHRALPVLAQLEAQYRGEIRLVFKHFPLASHPDAPLAAEYAAAAAEQGRFWELHDRLFAAQNALDRQSLRRRITEAGADVDRADQHLASARARTTVGEDRALGVKLGISGTPAFFVNGVKITGLVTLPQFQKVIEAELANARALMAGGIARTALYDELTKKARDAVPQTAARPAQVVRQNITLLPGAPRRGGAEPLVTIVEFTDFECPFCAVTVPMLAELSAELGDALAIEFRHLPVAFHPHAEAAATAALAAHRQGKFWEFHDALFADQKKLTEADLEALARKLKLKLDRFRADRKDPTLLAELTRDKDDAARYGVRATPTMFINGIPVRGVQPMGMVKAIVMRERALAERMIANGANRADIYWVIMRSEAGKPFDASVPLAESEGGGVTIGDAPIWGPRDAPVKVIVFSDFECPFCAQVAGWLKQVAAAMQGKVMIAFKHYPLPIHRNAELAAVASLAAGRQGKFWEMHDRLFAHQQELDRAALARHAQAIGIDAAKLETDLDDPELRLWVKRDTSEGVGLNITATPTLFIGSRRLEGVRSAADLEAAIRDELARGNRP